MHLKILPKKISAKFHGWLSYFLVLLKLLRWKIGTGKIPPGDLKNLWSQESRDQLFMLKRFEKYGPILKLRQAGDLAICMNGIQRCRRLLLEHDDDLSLVTYDLESLFPKGFLRQMSGQDHKNYRSILIKGIKQGVLEDNPYYYDSVIAENLSLYISNHQNPPSPSQYIRALDSIANGIQFRVFFGAEIGTDYFERIHSIYRQLGDEDWETFLRKRQKVGYVKLRDFLLETVRNTDSKGNPAVLDSILGRIHLAGSLDETILGNLIYMVETGRLALYSLMRWITKYASENPDILSHIAEETSNTQAEETSLSEAFVLETLRSNQIERLLRQVKTSFIFEGYRFPKNAIARLCLWEAHKSEETFPEPFIFNPDRFTEKQFTLDEFAPFGMGRHRCPLSDFSIQVCRHFIRFIAKNYSLEGAGDGPPVRGIDHYEPAKEFAVRFHPKQSVGTNELL